MYDTLIKTIDLIFKLSDTQIFQEVFSSEADICAELFYLDWKCNDTNESSETSIEKIKNYHKILLKNHTNPFIFKFYLFISGKISK